MNQGATASILTTSALTVSGQSAQYLIPRILNGTVLLYVHGLGENQTSPLGDSLKESMMSECLAQGYIIASSMAHGDAWGNQDSVDDYDALEADILSRFGSIYRSIIFGQSMGGLAGLIGLCQGKFSSVIGWVGIYPICNYESLGSENPTVRLAADFPDIPYRFYASQGDSSVPKATHSDAIASKFVGRIKEHDVVVCSGEHGDTSHFQTDDFLNFLKRCRNI